MFTPCSIGLSEKIVYSTNIGQRILLRAISSMSHTHGSVFKFTFKD